MFASRYPALTHSSVCVFSGRINKCGIISPRFDVDVHGYENWVANLLPSRQFGYLVLTTSYGIMDHEEARRKQTGGKVLGFFY
jgi:small subunit ribosomal protein S15Ae